MKFENTKTYSTTTSRLAAAALAVLLAPALHAATITVSTHLDDVTPNDFKCSIREALHNSNLNTDTTLGDCVGGSGVDTIFIPPAIYTITILGTGENGNATGDFDVLESVHIIGGGVDATIVDGANGSRVFDFDPALSTVVADISLLTIRNGDVSGLDGGAGIRVSATADVAVADVELNQNQATLGGAVLNDGLLTMLRVHAAQNFAPTLSGRGGGLYNRNVAVVDDCVFLTNTAGAEGGGTYNQWSLTSTASQWHDNFAGREGGGLFNEKTAVLNYFEIGNNRTGTLDGGGIFHGTVPDNGATLHLNHGIIFSNRAERDGGGMYSLNNVTITDVRFNDNVTDLGHGGGAAHVQGLLTADDLTRFDFNSAVDGGGLLNHAVANLTGSQIVDNNATRGGGAYNTGTLTCENCLVENNIADPRGGGMMNEGTLHFEHSLAASNTAATTGGGMVTTGSASELYVTNSTLSDNYAEAGGGGIEIDGGGTLFVVFSTLTLNNSGVGGGGLFNHGSGNVFAKNTIVQANGPVNCDIPSGLTSAGYNLDSGNTCNFIHPFPVDRPNTTANLGPLQFNGGPTRTHALLGPHPGNPAVDSADPGCWGLTGPAVADDQRHIVRPQNGAGAVRCDRGAYEKPFFNPTLEPPPGPAIIVDRLAFDGSVIELLWAVGQCSDAEYHAIYGDLDNVSSYTPLGSACDLGDSGVAQFVDLPDGNQWFLVLSSDLAQTEGSWGDSTGGIRNPGVPSNTCGNVMRDDTGTCP
ncbi:MAG: hypothetical protein GY716_04670 [bacterium]|nr:hypothetical protein [bacterium]